MAINAGTIESHLILNMSQFQTGLQTAGAMLTAFQNSGSVAGQQIHGVGEELIHTSDALTNTGEALENTADAVSETNDSLAETNQALADTSDTLAQTGNAAEDAGERIRTAGESTEEAGRKAEKTAQKIAAAGSKLQGIGNELTETGKTLTKNLTTPLLGAGVAAVKFTSDYESAFAGVRKTVDATEEEYQELSDSILEMSGKMPTVAEDISGVMEAAGQLGIQNKNLVGFTKTMVMLGDSTNLSANVAAESLAKFANVTNMSADDYARLGSTIVELGNNFATTEADIVGMGTRLASTGNLVGLSQSQIMAISTALSSCGIEAEAGGSAISKLLKQIDVAAKTFEKSNTVIQSTGHTLRELELMADQDTKAFKNIAGSLGMTTDELKNCMTHASDLNAFSDVAGISAQEFVKAWGNDAVGALGLFIDGLNDTERNGRSAVEILDEMGINEVRLSNAVLSLASSEGILNKAVDMANTAWDENTALAHEAEQRYATFDSRCKILGNQVKALGISFGKELMPAAEDLVGTAGNAVKWFGSLDSGAKRLIVNAGLVTASLGPVLMITGKLTSGVGALMDVAGTAVSSFSALRAGTIGLGTALTNIISPAGWVVLGLAAVTAAGVALYKDLHRANDKLNEFNGIMERAAETSKDIDEITESLNNLKEARLDNYANQIGEIETVDHLKEKLADLVDENGKLIGSKDELKSVIQQLKDKGFNVELNKTGDLIKNYSELTDSISKYVEQKKAQAMLDSLEPEYQNALKEKAKYYSVYVDSLSEALELQKLLNDEEYVQGLTPKEFQKLSDAYSELIGKANAAYNSYQSACDKIDVYDKSMAAIVKGDFETATELLSGYYEDIGSTIKKKSDYAKEEQEKAVIELSNQFMQHIQAYGAAMQTGDEAVLSDAKTYLEQAAGELEKAGVKLPEGLIQGIEDGSISVENAIAQLGTVTNSAIDKIVNDGVNQSSEKLNQLKTDLIDTLNNYETALSQGLDYEASLARNHISEITNELDELGIHISDTMISGLMDGSLRLDEVFTQIGDNSAVQIEQQNDKIMGPIQEGVDNVTSTIESAGPRLSSAGKLVFESMSAEFNKLPGSATEASQNAVDGMISPFESVENQGKIKTATKGFVKLIPDASKEELDENSPSKVMDKIGGFAIDGLIGGMESKKGSVVSSIGGIMQNMLTAAQGVDFTPVGSNIVGGILSGLNARKNSLLATAGSLANSISTKIKSALKINSPSRVMMEIGEFTTAGMELGLMKGSQSLYETASAISRDTAEALSGITPTVHTDFSGSFAEDKLDRLLEAVERLADSRPTMEIDGRPFGRLVREYV